MPIRTARSSSRPMYRPTARPPSGYRQAPNARQMHNGSRLRLGHQGQTVNDLQTRLNHAGLRPPLSVDGKFGPNTEAAVRAFQTRHNLPANGEAGAHTLGALRSGATFESAEKTRARNNSHTAVGSSNETRAPKAEGRRTPTFNLRSGLANNPDANISSAPKTDPDVAAMTAAAGRTNQAQAAPGGTHQVQAAPGGSPRAIAQSITHIRGTATARDAEAVINQLCRMPPAHLAHLQSSGVTVNVCRNSIVEHRPDLAGQTPRGWPPGSSYSQCTGIYNHSSREIVVATNGAGRVVSGSFNTVLHEAGHAMDSTRGGLSGSAAFQEHYARAIQPGGSDLGGYFRQPGIGPSEAYAESYARCFGGYPNHASRSPALHQYWSLG